MCVILLVASGEVDCALHIRVDLSAVESFPAQYWPPAVEIFSGMDSVLYG